jgi:SAM-dependent methyltransferase
MSVDLQDRRQSRGGHGFRWDASLISRAASQTHFHLLSVVNTEIARIAPLPGRKIRLLDVGCGDGNLLLYLSKALHACWPSLEFELYGFDVGDHGLQAPTFFRDALARLEAAAPSGRWRERLALISENDSWPYEAGFFDAVVSNQVLEHVRYQPLFFSELGRVLHAQGFSAHLYPSHHCLIEPHLHVPFAHWFRDVELLGAWLRLSSKIGLSTYRHWAQARRRSIPALDDSLETYVREHRAFLAHLTNYKTQRETHSLAKASGQTSSFSYTGCYYTGKLRSLLGRERAPLHDNGSPFTAALANLLFRYVSSVTLLTRSDPNRLPGKTASAASGRSLLSLLA